jgi:hypothetical protein
MIAVRVSLCVLIQAAFPFQPPFAPPVVSPRGSKTSDGRVLGWYTTELEMQRSQNASQGQSQSRKGEIARAYSDAFERLQTDRGSWPSVSTGSRHHTPHLHQNTPAPFKGQTWDDSMSAAVLGHQGAGAVMTEEEMFADFAQGARRGRESARERDSARTREREMLEGWQGRDSQREHGLELSVVLLNSAPVALDYSVLRQHSW